MRSTPTALLTTAFSLFMLVVYNNDTGRVVDYARVVGKQACHNLTIVKKEAVETIHGKRVFGKYLNAHKAKFSYQDEYGKYAYSGPPSGSYRMRCYPLNQWR